MPTESPVARRRVYTHAVWIVLAALAVVCTSLGAWGVAQGPRLRAVATDPAALVSTAGSPVTLTADQPLADHADVQVQPAVPFDVTVDGPRLIVRFRSVLDYASDYRITADVSGSMTGRQGRIDTTVSTADAQVYLLEPPAAGTPDEQLVRAPLRGAGADETVFTARRIDSYAVVGQSLSVLSSDGSTDSLVTIDGDTRQDVALEPGTHSDLRASDLGQLGWVQDSGSRADGSPYFHNLFVSGPAADAGPREIVGFSGQPLDVIDWRFVPGTTSVVVQDDDQQVYVIDTQAGGDPTPLGRFGAFQGFLPGTAQLLIGGPGTSVTAIDFASGDRSVIDAPAVELPDGAYPGIVRLRSADSAIAQWDAHHAGSAGYLRSSTLALVDADGTTPIVPPSTDGSWIDRYCLSPNGLYLSVQVVAADGRVVGSTQPVTFSDSQLQFVDIATGEVVRTIPGAVDAEWCR